MKGTARRKGQLFVSTCGNFEVGRFGGGPNMLDVWPCATKWTSLLLLESPLCLLCQSGTETHAILERLTIPALNKTKTAELVGSLKVQLSQAHQSLLRDLNFTNGICSLWTTCCLSWILIICASTTRKEFWEITASVVNFWEHPGSIHLLKSTGQSSCYAQHQRLSFHNPRRVDSKDKTCISSLSGGAWFRSFSSTKQPCLDQFKPTGLVMKAIRCGRWIKVKKVLEDTPESLLVHCGLSTGSMRV